jgi:hypothetical protein
MQKARCWVVLVCMILFPMTLSSPAVAQDYELPLKTLDGLKGVYVSIEPLDPEIKGAGLTENQLKMDVERKLRKAGIKVLTKQEWSKTPGRPAFWVRIGNARLESNHFFYIIVGLIQDVNLSRAPSFQTSAPTWYISSGIATTGGKLAELCRRTVKEMTDVFINQYLSVNPK